MSTEQSQDAPIVLGVPDAIDGRAVHALIDRCKPLDPNSLYCNLLQCSQFADTCAIAKRGDDVVGFLSGHRLPDRPDTLFVWQVAVDASARGVGLAKRLLHEVLGREQNRDIRYLQCTINPGNDASWGLFESFAKAMGADSKKEVIFDRDEHFGGEHESEVLFEIGPFEFSGNA